MSVFRVLKLMDQLRLDTSYYKQQLQKLLPRMDAHIAQRGPWQVEALLPNPKHDVQENLSASPPASCTARYYNAST